MPPDEYPDTPRKGCSYLYRAAYVLVLFMTLSDLAGAGPREPQSPTDRRVLLVANTQKGEALFQNRCSMCHAVQAEGPNKLGPDLHGLFGRRAGTAPGYNYSSDMRASRIVWSAQTLDTYLADPHRGIPDAQMPYLGLSGKTDRDDLISYLEQATR
jgi:cytochrome c